MTAYTVPSQERSLSEAAGVPRDDSDTDPLHPDNRLRTDEFPLTENPPPDRPPLLRFIFFGPHGLRPGWGILLFVMIFVCLATIVNTVHHKLYPATVKTPAEIRAAAEAGQTPRSMLTAEGVSFAMIGFATWIMSRLERRPMRRYGFGGTQKGAPFLAGFAWGLLFLATLVGSLWKLHLLVFDRRLLFGAGAWEYGGIWLVGFVLVGLLEEYMLRGYLQYTFARGAASLYQMLFGARHSEALGFWTAAAALSFVFGIGHGKNPGESVIGLWSAGLIGIIFCLTLWKTGSLWWALGFHASWDWAQSFVFGVADSGTMVQGHLFASHPSGKLLLSGGATGPEGSALILPLLAVLVLVIVATLPKRRWSIESAGS